MSPDDDDDEKQKERNEKKKHIAAQSRSIESFQNCQYIFDKVFGFAIRMQIYRGLYDSIGSNCPLVTIMADGPKVRDWKRFMIVAGKKFILSIGHELKFKSKLFAS